MNVMHKRSIKNNFWRVMPPSVRGSLANLVVRGLPESERFRLGLPYMMGLLGNLKKNGFTPQTVIDVGANVGDWSHMASQVFPSAKFFMIEGNPDNELALRHSVNEVGQNSEYSILLLGAEEKDGVIFHKLNTGSSVLPELTTYHRSQVTLPMGTLDGLMGNRHYDSPVLLKLDVQGFELQVLLGGADTLSGAEVVIMETSLLPYNENAPLFAEVVAFMAARGFFAFDFCGQLRRQTDDTLFQTDVVFVWKDSVLRAPRRFWWGEP